MRGEHSKASVLAGPMRGASGGLAAVGRCRPGGARATSGFGTCRSWAIAALASWLLLAPAPSAIAGENPYTNEQGITSATFLDKGFLSEDDYDRASVSVNPGGAGQMLLGSYYDVRLLHGVDGSVDPQQTRITIRNLSPADPTSPGYNPLGGVLFRFALREANVAVLTMTFPVLIGCGQTWHATIFRGAEGFPYIRSDDPIVREAGFDKLFTGPVIAGPDGDVLRILGFIGNDTSPIDIQTGRIEIYAIEAAACQPDDPPVSLRGNTWTRPNIDGTRSIAPQNVLSGTVDVVRVLRETSASYEMTALARYRPVSDTLLFPGAAPISVIFGNEIPNEQNCLGFEPGGAPFGSSLGCVRQFNTALSKSRVRLRFHTSSDDPPPLAALALRRTFNCVFTANLRPLKAYAGTPFACDPTGEPVALSVQSDTGEVVARKTLRLKRASTLLAIGGTDPLADLTIDTKGLTSGVVELDFVRDKKRNLLHREIVPTFVDVLGAGHHGYEGLPLTVSLLQPTAYGPGGAVDVSEPVYDVSYLTELPAGAVATSGDPNDPRP